MENNLGRPQYANVVTAPDGDVWKHLEKISERGQQALLSAQQVTIIVSERARLIEDKNTLVREIHAIEATVAAITKESLEKTQEIEAKMRAML